MDQGRLRVADYQIDPHLRHDFPPNPKRPARWTRLRLWWRRQQFRLGRWVLRLPLFHQDSPVGALQVLVLGLSLIVLFQMVLLILTRPNP
jgi:hypothetical protein